MGDRPAPTLGAFRVLEPLARGGMSEVWRAEHSSGLPCAVKVALPAEGGAWSARSVQLEARAMAALHHPHIVSVYDTGVVDAAASSAAAGMLPVGAPWVAMELAAAGNLATRRPLDWPIVQGILLDLLDALAHAHARTVLHRDLKPSNVLFTDEGDGQVRVVLSDFGIGWLKAEGRPVEAGTPAFMAPEQFDRMLFPEGPWTDLYALGCLTWAIVCGRVPYRGSEVAALRRQHRDAPVPALSPRFPIPEGLHGWVRTLMGKHPRDRFQRAAGAAWALARLGEPVEAGFDLSTLDVVDTGSVPVSERTTLVLQSMPGSRAPLARQEAERGPAAPLAPDPHLPMRAPPVAAGPGLIGLRSVPVVGRREEKERLWAALHRVVSSGWTGVVVLHGPSGVGTSSLADWLCIRAHEVGATVYEATYAPVAAATDGLRGLLADRYPLDYLEPFVMADALEDLLIEEGVTDPWERQAVLQVLHPGAASVRLDPAERYAVVRRALCRAVDPDRPLVLWLDDVEHGTDALRFVGYLIDHPERVPALVVMTTKRVSSRLRDIVDRCGGLVIGLTPVSPPDAARALEGVLPLAPGLAAELVERTTDPDMALQWLARHRDRLVSGADGLSVFGGVGVLAPLPELWDAEVSALEPTVREALEVAALLGVQVDFDEWMEACAGCEIPASDAVLDDLFARRLLVPGPDGPRRFAFTHPRLRQQVEAACAAAGRAAAMHRVCAERLAARGWSSAERRARHLVQAGEARAGAQVLIDAVEGLANTDVDRSHRAAEAWVSLARQHLPDDDPMWGPGLARVVKTRRFERRRKAHAEAVQQLLAWAEAEGSDLDLAFACEELAWSLRDAGDLEGAEQAARRSLEAAQRSGDASRIGWSWSALAETRRRRGDLDGAEALYRNAWEQGEGDARLFGGLSLAYVLAESGRLDDGRAVLDEVRAALPDDPSVGPRAALLHALAENLRLSGDPAAAVPLFREAMEVQRHRAPNDVTLEINLCLALIALGRDAEALDRLEAIQRQVDRLAVTVKAIVLSGLLVLWLRRPQIDRALGALETLAELPATSGCADGLVLLRTASDLLEKGGRPNLARRLLGVAIEQAEALHDAAARGALAARRARLAAPRDTPDP